MVIEKVFIIKLSVLAQFVFISEKRENIWVVSLGYISSDNVNGLFCKMSHLCPAHVLMRCAAFSKSLLC